MSIHDLEIDVDVVRCDLRETEIEALALADELALANETDASLAERQRVTANYRQARTRMRRLRTLLRVEEGLR